MDLRTTVSLLLLLLGLCNAHRGSDQDGAGNEILEDKSNVEDITTTILRMNSRSSDFLLEGDVFIPKTKNAMKCLNKAFSCLWPKSANRKVEIPFLISQEYDDTEKSTILQATKDFESKTCIRFIPRANQTAYISIEPRVGCSSLLGRIGDKQVVSLQKFGCVQTGIIQHELLHVLGFYHEHTRSDRDQHVKINWENISEYFVKDFQLMDTNNLNTPYDYSSIMHYGRTAFGKNGLETITPIPDASVPIGQTVGLSAVDIIKINRLYNC